MRFTADDYAALDGPDRRLVEAWCEIHGQNPREVTAIEFLPENRVLFHRVAGFVSAERLLEDQVEAEVVAEFPVAR